MKIDTKKYLASKQRITDGRRGYPLYSFDEYSELDYSKGATYTCCDLGNNVEALKEHRRS